MSVIVSESDGGTKKEAKKALKKLKKAFDEGKELGRELNKIWDKIKVDAIGLCPKETGTLASTIRTTRLPLGMMTGSWSRIKEVTIFNKSIIAGDITKINPKSKRPCDYATWVHDGHRMRDGKIYAGVPFLTMALAQNEAELNKVIDRVLRKLGKKHLGSGP